MGDRRVRLRRAPASRRRGLRHWLARRRRRARAPAPAALVVEELEPRILYSTFTVTSTADPHFLFFPILTPDTLRWAIEQANANPGLDTIAFDIGTGVQTILPESQLPWLSDAVVIDGTTQGGYAGEPLIVLDGSLAGFLGDGLVLDADGITVRGLAIHSFGNDGIEIRSDGNVIEGNYIGVDADGVTGRGNLDDGIDTVTSSFNVIRGNVIGDNREDGVDLYASGSHDNAVQGNWIGTDKTGSINLGNYDHGVHLSDSFFGGDTHDNVIGGTGSGEANVIAFNRDDGVHVADGDRNEIRGNAIYNNNLLAIRLSGSGNDAQNDPDLTTADADASSIRIQGDLSSSASEIHSIDFFSNPDADREGRVYLGSTTVTTDGGGDASFDVAFAAAITPGHYVTATATDAFGNTSEFSTGIQTNMAPTANADSYSVIQGGTLVESAPGLLANDVDPEGDPMTAALVVGPSRGTLVLNPDGSFSYTRTDPGLTADSFSYRTQDANGTSNVATVTLTVTAQQPPTAVDDPSLPGSYATDEDTVLNVGAASGVLANDTDPELDPLTVQSLDTAGTMGAVALNADGSFTYDPRGALDFLAAGEGLNDVFRYTVSDGNGGTDIATVTVVVTGLNDAPLGVDNANDVEADASAPVNGNMLSDDDGAGVDADPDASDVLVVGGIDGVVDPATDVVGSYGSLDWAADGTYSYSVDTANAAVQALGTGAILVDVFTYTVDDGVAATDTAKLTITIHGVNDAPTATDNTNTIAEDAVAPVAGNVLTNDDGAGVDSDPDAGDTLTAVNVNGETDPLNDVVGLYGTLDWELDGAYSYTIDNANALVQALSVGQSLTDDFTYTVRDPGGLTDSATLTVTITGTNDGPTATANTNTIAEDAVAPVAGNVITDDDGAGVDSDPDASDILGVSSVDGVANPGTDVVGSYGTLDWETSGAYSYTVDNANPAVQELAVGESVADVFTFAVADGQGGTDTATLTVSLTGTNDAPVVTGGLAFPVDAASAAGTVVGRIEAMDPDTSDSLTFQLAPASSGGSFALLPTGEIVYLGADSLGSLPAGPVSLEVEVLDGQGGPPTLATVELSVTAVVPIVDLEPPSDPESPEPPPAAEADPAPDESPGALRPVVADAEPLVLGPPSLEADASGDLGDELHPVVGDLDTVELPPLVLDAGDERDDDEPDRVEHAPPAALDLAGHEPAHFDDQVAEADQNEVIQASAAATAVVALSAGFLSFLLRGGSLLAALLASLPMWHRVDVLAVLALSDKERKKRKEDIARQEEAEARENEALAALFGGDAAQEADGRHERRAP